MLTIQALTPQQVAHIYHTYMPHDFAAAEIKPLAGILQLMEQGLYRGYGLWEEGALRGYALLMTAPGGRVPLLDYLAILSDQRGSGYGSRFLQLLQTELADFDGIVLEAEAIAYAVGRADRAVRTRRIAFYRRNGLRATSLQSHLFGVTLSVLYLPCGRDISDGQLYRELDAMYRLMFPVWLSRYTQLSMRHS